MNKASKSDSLLEVKPFRKSFKSRSTRLAPAIMNQVPRIKLSENPASSKSYVENMTIPSKHHGVTVTYTGEMLNNLFHGKGKIILVKGGKLKSYEGDFKAGEIIGSGKLTYPSGEYVVGEFFVGIPHGKVKLFTSDHKLAYEGDMVRGKYHGQGSRMGAGRTYVGEFFAGKSHGKGLIYDVTGTVIWEGEMFDGKPVKK